MTLDDIKRLGKDKAKAQKQATYKQADSVAFHDLGGSPMRLIIVDKNQPDVVTKEAVENWKEKDSITVKAVINTTNIIDSHSDLHLKGIWDDHLKTNPRVAHLQEHKNSFSAIISEGSDLKAHTEEIEWKDLGYGYTGKAQCLVFDSTVRKERNPFMFEQYAKGYVQNHSVGMRYGEIELCVNSEDKYWKEEKANWDEYIKEAVNPEAAEKQGYFWAVKSATFSEGSAVVFGSNPATPTTEAKTDLEDFEQDKDEITNENEREIDAQKLRARRLALLKVKD